MTSSSYQDWTEQLLNDHIKDNPFPIYISNIYAFIRDSFIMPLLVLWIMTNKLLFSSDKFKQKKLGWTNKFITNSKFYRKQEAARGQ